MQESFSNNEIGTIRVKFIGVLKGLAKQEELSIQVSTEEISLIELFKLIIQLINNNEFAKRVFNSTLTQISPDVMVSYEDKIISARGNEKMKIKKGSILTVFSFVHGG
jgi:Urm1 (Ubiquitin related modifier).